MAFLNFQLFKEAVAEAKKSKKDGVPFIFKILFYWRKLTILREAKYSLSNLKVVEGKFFSDVKLLENKEKNISELIK